MLWTTFSTVLDRDCVCSSMYVINVRSCSLHAANRWFARCSSEDSSRIFLSFSSYNIETQEMTTYYERGSKLTGWNNGTPWIKKEKKGGGNSIRLWKLRANPNKYWVSTLMTGTPKLKQEVDHFKFLQINIDSDIDYSLWNKQNKTSIFQIYGNLSTKVM